MFESIEAAIESLKLSLEQVAEELQQLKKDVKSSNDPMKVKSGKKGKKAKFAEKATVVDVDEDTVPAQSYWTLAQQLGAVAFTGLLEYRAVPLFIAAAALIWSHGDLASV